MPARIVHDIVYAEPVGFRPLSLDLHLPDADDPPVVVFVHGGGWRVGSRRTFSPGLDGQETFGRIVRAGWAVASVDYRLSGEAIFPAQLDDVAAALDWIRGAGSRDHGLDGSRLALWGESAGGHLAALAGLTDPGVRAVVAWYAPADLLTLPQTDGDPSSTREAGLLGGPVAERADLARAASPARLVRAGAPPFLLAHGDQDAFVPLAQSLGFADRLRDAGVDVRMQVVQGADHLWRGLEDASVVFDPALDFLDRMVRGTRT
ncbi:MAG: lip2 2 [Microbacterium sp.]|nr:lip2 2 [Microbacterium sp.]